MKKLLTALTLFIGLHVNAGVIEGTLYDIEPTDGSSYAATLDFWHFTVNNDGNVTFDILSWEAEDYDSNPVDHNGDGEIAFFDSYLWLFNDDGILDDSDFITSDDDGGLGSDGSTYGYDSYLSMFLTAGDYIIAVGSCCDNADDLDYVNGIQNGGSVASADAAGNFYYTYNGDDVSHGDYQLTYTGDMVLTNGATDVPEPTTLAIFALGLVGLATRRRKT